MYKIALLAFLIGMIHAIPVKYKDCGKYIHVF